MYKKPIITLSDKAALHIKSMLQKRKKESVGIRIDIKSSSCGLSYSIEYADTQESSDEVVIDKGVTLLIDTKSIIYLLGTEIDFIEDISQSGLTFVNPNEKSRCSCGKKFNTK